MQVISRKHLQDALIAKFNSCVKKFLHKRCVQNRQEKEEYFKTSKKNRRLFITAKNPRTVELVLTTWSWTDPILPMNSW